MKVTVRQPVAISDNNFTLKEIDINDIKIDYYSVLSIDGSTSNTGLALLRESDGGLLYSIAVKRDTKEENPVRYKLRLKKMVKEMLSKNKLVTTVYYEEPVIANPSSVSNLFMLRTFIEEMIIEEEPYFDYIKHYEINNKRWKKLFLAPDKCPVGTELEKKAVRTKLESYLPFLKDVTQDEIDAISMGFAACKFLKEGNTAEELESKKKISKFMYNIQFLATEKDDDMFVELYDVYKGPRQLLENGICFSEIDGKTNFEKHIYKKMGVDDKLLIIKFSSKYNANLILQYKIGNLAAQFPYIYALVWRKTRKL